jgi:hypothetical protein
VVIEMMSFSCGQSGMGGEATGIAVAGQRLDDLGTEELSNPVDRRDCPMAVDQASGLR